MCNAWCRETTGCVLFSLFNSPDPDPGALKRCDLWKGDCTYDTANNFDYYDPYDPGTVSVADISNTEGVLNGDKIEFTVPDVASVRQFETKLGYEFKGPKLLKSTVYCPNYNTKGISMTDNSNIKSCDELCNNTPNCV